MSEGFVDLSGFSVELRGVWNRGVFGVELRGFCVELRGFSCRTEGVELEVFGVELRVFFVWN